MLKIYEMPVQDVCYVVAADSASCRSEHSDLDAAVVRRCDTARVVATMQGRWEISEFARRLAALGYLYNTALLVPESNDNTTGEALVGCLIGKLGGPILYENIYQQERIDRFSGRRNKAFGWRTTRRSKHAIVAAQAELIREGEEQDTPREILDEARSFMHDGRGGMGAQAGRNDDLVIAWCISAMCVTAGRNYAESGVYDAPPAKPCRVEEILENAGEVKTFTEIIADQIGELAL